MEREIRLHPEMEDCYAEPIDRDRDWFHRHPGVNLYLRPQWPDEQEARDAFYRVAWGPCQLAQVEGWDRQGWLPNTWVAVVNLTLLGGEPLGPNGESLRCRIPCPEPVCEDMAQAICEQALDIVLQHHPHLCRRRRSRRCRGRGFGRSVSSHP